LNACLSTTRAGGRGVTMAGEQHSKSDAPRVITAFRDPQVPKRRGHGGGAETLKKGRTGGRTSHVPVAARWRVSCLIVIVDCWIGVAQEPGGRVVRLAGRFSAEQVPDLLGACAGGAPTAIDLTDLVSADAAGIEVLQRLRRQGATLLGTPGYLQLKIDSPTTDAASDPVPPDANRAVKGRPRRVR
jgi:hypothetical protein